MSNGGARVGARSSGEGRRTMTTGGGQARRLATTCRHDVHATSRAGRASALGDEVLLQVARAQRLRRLQDARAQPAVSELDVVVEHLRVALDALAGGGGDLIEAGVRLEEEHVLLRHGGGDPGWRVEGEVRRTEGGARGGEWVEGGARWWREEGGEKRGAGR